MTLADWLIRHGHASDESDADQLIARGIVRVDGKVALNANRRLIRTAQVHIRSISGYVSRGGEKLADALQTWRIDPGGMCWLDVGASTGGFTDCLIQHGARFIHALDVGRGLLDPKLERDASVRSWAQTHVDTLSTLTFEPVPEASVIDLSFIPLDRALSAIHKAFGSILTLALYKPQFEIGRRAEGFDGVIRDIPLIIADLSSQLASWTQRFNWPRPALHDCALPGRRGNIEVWLGFGVSAGPMDGLEKLSESLELRHSHH